MKENSYGGTLSIAKLIEERATPSLALPRMKIMDQSKFHRDCNGQ